MPVDLSFQEMAAFGAIIAALAVLVLVVLLGVVVSVWIARRASRFRSFGIERTPQGSVQFKGLVEGAEQRRAIDEGRSFLETTLGPSKFPPREDEEPATTETPN
jgi:hypothetical protein